MADICLSEKGAGVRPFVVGAMKPALFEESERRIKNATEVVGRNAESDSILAGNIQPMRNEPTNTNTGTAKQPQITGGKSDTEDAHQALKAIVIGMWVGTTLNLLFLVPENTALKLQKPNVAVQRRAAFGASVATACWATCNDQG